MTEKYDIRHYKSKQGNDKFGNDFKSLWRMWNKQCLKVGFKYIPNGKDWWGKQ